MTLTPWFEGKIKPVRRGFYQRERNSVIIYSFWTGKHWLGNGATHIREAIRMLDFKCKSLHQNTQWRGVNEQSY